MSLEKLHNAMLHLDPFKRPAIVMKPVTLEKLIELMRVRVGKGYMPTGLEDKYHSKPRYIRAEDEKAYRHACLCESYPTFVCWDQEYGGYGEIGAVLPIRGGGLSILVELTSLKAWVAVPVGLQLTIWEWTADKELPVDLLILAETIENL